MASTRTYRRRCDRYISRGHGGETDLDWVLVREEVDDFECVCDDADGHELLAIVTALHHQTASRHKNRSRLAALELKGWVTCPRDVRRWASGLS